MKDAWLYQVTRPIITIWFKLFFTPKIIGRENILPEGRIILAGNHTNNLDCLLLISATKRNIHFIAKKELWQGLKKIIFANMGLIPVDRRKKSPEVIEKAKEYLESDKVIGIFPEGTISKTKDLLPFKYGAVKMAKETNSFIVPFVITGKYRLFSRDLKIKFLKPIKVNDDLEKENTRLRDLIVKERG